MDEAKWTPGPWFVKRTDWRGEPAGHKLYVAGNPYDIPAEDEDGNETDEVAGTGCTAVAIVEGNATSRTTTEANARLMAAAPAMAEAIRATLDRLDYLRGLWGDEGVTRTLCDRLRAALPADGA